MITIINVYVSQLPINLPVMAFLMLFMSQTAFLLPASSVYGALAVSYTHLDVYKRQADLLQFQIVWSGQRSQ